MKVFFLMRLESSVDSVSGAMSEGTVEEGK